MHLRVAALDGKSGVEAAVEEAAVGDGDESARWLVWAPSGGGGMRVVVVVFSLNGNLRKLAVPGLLLAWRHTSPPADRRSYVLP